MEKNPEIKEKEVTVTNLDYLKQLANGDEAFLQEMISIFLNQTPAEVKKLEAFVEEENYSGIREKAHKLKSSVQFVGLNILSQLKTMENLGATGQGIETIRPLFAEVKETIDTAVEELSEIQKK